MLLIIGHETTIEPLCHSHTLASLPMMHACKQDTERHVIVLVYYKCVCVCEAVSVSWSGIHPCVLWTKLVC